MVADRSTDGELSMSKPKERTICHASSTLLHPQATSQIQKGFDSCSDRGQNVDYRGKSGKCNMCSAPCSSCFHMNQVLSKSTEESAGETCAENIVVDNEMSTVDTMISTSDSSENAEGKAFSRTSNTSATNAMVVHSKFEAQKIPDDCLSHDRNLRGVEEDKFSAPHGAHSEVSSEHMNSLLTGDVVTDICGALPAKALNSAEKNVGAGVDIHLVDDTDDSDMVEQDVKVCDICGDAGREDLLAICCRCIDGAEHTYCMREKMAKIPEGDWLCEECTSREQMRSQRQDKIGRVDGSEKNNSSGQAINEHVNAVDVEVNRSRSGVKIPNKSLRDDADAEVSSIMKKPAVESMVRLPKSSLSEKAAALSRDNSLKNLDTGRVQSSHVGLSSDAVSVNNHPKLAQSASDLRVHNSQGVFSRSNSFTSINSKPKVKLVDHVLRRQKSVKEVAPYQLKDGGIRSIDKSMLFRAKSSIGFESKTKMLSPRLSHIQDMKISKQRNTFKRQSSFKSKHAPTNSITENLTGYVLRSDKKQAYVGESCQISTSTNHLEARSEQPDGRSAALSRSFSLSSRKSSNLPSSLGEFKRPALYTRNAHGGVFSPKGVNNIDKNSNRSNSKDSSSCSGVSERSPLNADEDQHDGLSQLRESSNSGEPLMEQAGSCSRPSYVNSSWDKNNNLKGAIQAAMLRKPGVCQKYRSDDALTSNMGCDIASKDHSSSSAVRRNESSAAEVADKHTLSQNLSSDTLGLETLNNKKHFPSEPVEACSGGDGTQVLLDWKSSSKGMMFSNDAAGMAIFSKSLAIPKYEYLWQGSFDICRSGKMFVSWDGIQAHLSISTSPKVLDVVKKFKNRIVLSEVPRLSTWPIQFQERGVVEDNIALFFFAKDLESYNKIYKVWLENIMKNDLALKGNVNGVELLIFPSNQLPENSQRWNMMFFLWGVFRGKKESRFGHIPENRCSLPRARDFPACVAVPPDPKLNTSVEFCSSLSYGERDGDCDARVSSVECLDGRLNSSSSTAARSFSAKQCQELRDSGPEEGINLSSGPLQRRPTINVSGRKQMSMQFDTPLGSQHPSYHFDKSRDDVLDISADKGIEEVTMLEKACSSSQDQVQFSANANNDAVRNQLHGALGKMNHRVASGSHEVENQHHDEACNETVIPKHSKKVFSMEQSRPWEAARSSEQTDRLLDLELALGAERKRKTRAIEQVMVDKQERETTEECILDEAAVKEEDDVSSALSLSLSFPLAKEE